jgi:hypothetical protein
MGIVVKAILNKGCKLVWVKVIYKVIDMMVGLNRVINLVLEVCNSKMVIALLDNILIIKCTGKELIN